MPHVAPGAADAAAASAMASTTTAASADVRRVVALLSSTMTSSVVHERESMRSCSGGPLYLRYRAVARTVASTCVVPSQSYLHGGPATVRALSDSLLSSTARGSSAV